MLRFREIFKDEGMYVSENCCEGECYLICENKNTTFNEIYFCTYASAFDTEPKISNLIVYESLFEHKYIKIESVFKLFINKGEAHP